MTRTLLPRLSSQTLHHIPSLYNHYLSWLISLIIAHGKIPALLLPAEEIKINTDFCSIARTVIQIESQALAQLNDQIDNTFDAVCQLVLRTKGHVIVIGMGKSGHIGKKIAATLASTGTPAFFMHPAEACHGDLGMISSEDIVLAISYSGETEEVLHLLPVIRFRHIPLVAITGNPNSRLQQAAQYTLLVTVDKEACPLGLAPTASTTATLVMGDALAMAVLQGRGFSADDFARVHPRGSLGKKLLMRVADLMHIEANIPIVKTSCSVATALIEMTQKRLGMTVVVEPKNSTLQGVFTDGDLRRTLENCDIYNTPIHAVMTSSCTVVIPSMLAVEALHMMREKHITVLPVVDPERRPIGVLHIHDLLQAGIL